MVLALDTTSSQQQPVYYFKRRDFFPPILNQLWHIESGFVRTLTWDSKGNIFVLGLWSAGDVVGPPLSSSEHYQIECLSSVHARRLPSMYQCPRSELLLYLRRTEQLLQIRQIRSVKGRLGCLLNYLADQFGQKGDRGTLLHIRLTHQDIADVIGSSRVTVTRLMGDLHRQGKLLWQCKDRRRFLQIPNQSDSRIHEL